MISDWSDLSLIFETDVFSDAFKKPSDDLIDFSAFEVFLDVLIGSRTFSSLFQLVFVAVAAAAVAFLTLADSVAVLYVVVVWFVVLIDFLLFVVAL